MEKKKRKNENGPLSGPPHIYIFICMNMTYKMLNGTLIALDQFRSYSG